MKIIKAEMKLKYSLTLIKTFYMQTEPICKIILQLKHGCLLTFISIQWSYITFNLLKKYKLTKIYSPLDLMMKLVENRKIKISNQWYLTETTKTTHDLLNKLKIPIS